MDAEEMCDAFALGVPAGPATMATTGWGGHNRLWRIETDAGVFAVKEVRRELPPDPEQPFAIERQAHAAGIPSARPIPAVTGECLAHLPGDAVVRCHEWVEGDAKTNEDTTLAEAADRGRIVADLHSLDLEPGRTHPKRPFGAAHWLGLAARRPNAEWARAVAENIDLIERAERAATWAHPGPLIGSHRDLNAHNVLFDDERLVLIDWEAAGATSSSYERAAFAVIWGQRHDGGLDPDRTAAFLRGYLDNGGTIHNDDIEALGIWLAGVVGWTEQNLRLALHDIGDDQDHMANLLVHAVITGPDTVTIRRRYLTDVIAAL